MSGGYGYEVRSYNNTNSTVASPVAEIWKKLDYTETDHGARQQPYIPSTVSYVVKKERIIEKVHSPPTVIEYSTVSPVEYGVEGNRWGRRVSSPVDDRPRKVEEFVTHVQTEVSSQPQLLRPSTRLSSEYKHGSYQSIEHGRQQESDRWRRSSSPISPPMAEYGGQTNTWESRIRPSSQVYDTEENRSPLRPGYLSNTSRVTPVTEHTHNSNSPPKIHTTENNPWLRNSPQPSMIRSANWPQTPNSGYKTTQRPQTGYESYNDYNYKGNEMEKGRLGGHSYHYDETPKDYVTEQYKYMSTELPSPKFTGTWKRPSPAGSWATTTTNITRPMNDINEAVNYLAGALQQSSLTHGSPQQQYYKTLGHPKMEHYADTIDSREAQSRYGKFNGSLTAREGYATTIDSREALQKYGGAAV